MTRRQRGLAVLLVVLLVIAAKKRRGPARPAAAAQAVDSRTIPIGWWAGNPPLPLDASVTIFDQRQQSMLGPPGIRLGSSSDRSGRYFGTDTVPAAIYPGARANRDVDLEMADLHVPYNRTGPGSGGA